jgi:chromosome condensin MukBEF ATPase and DNA-binding subunit MukB
MDMSHSQQKRSKANQDFLKKEDIYDSLITLKTELNRVTAENTKVKTKLAIQQDHLKNKDKFIDELLKSTYVMS